MEPARTTFPDVTREDVEPIAQTIRFLRCHRVILDSDLAAIYGVSTGRLNEAVKRSSARFPQDFMFRLSVEESAALLSQFATSKEIHGGRRKDRADIAHRHDDYILQID
jgi:hypothetical protein